MSIYKKNSHRPLLWVLLLLPLIFILSCEDFEEQTYTLSNQEQLICDRLADTLSHDVTGADFRLFGPIWTGDNIDAALEIAERIGVSWYDEDFVLRPDVFVFIEGADTIAAMQFIDFAYDAASEQVDSIQIAYIYNPAGSISFAGLAIDTILIEDSHTTTAYIDFSQGLTVAGSDWNISIEGATVKQMPTGKVFRKEISSILAFNKAPTGNYLSDNRGYNIALNYLNSDSIFLTSPDSLLLVTLESNTDAGYVLWDRQDLGSADIIFNATDYITIAIWDESGVKLEPTDESISMQTIAYCHDVKTRTVYELEEEAYLIQFLPHEEMVEQDFRLAIVEGE